MKIYEEDWITDQSEETIESTSPRVCLIMPRFYPLFGGHIVQMMYFLPRLKNRGISSFVVTGMIEGDPKINSMRDLLRGLRNGKTENGRFPRLTHAVKGFIQNCKQTIQFIRQNPSCYRQPSLTVDTIDIYRLPTWGPIQSIRVRFFAFTATWFLIRNRHQYDIIHLVGTSWITYISIILAKLLGKKSVIEMVLLDSDDPETIAHRRFGKLNLAIWKRADRIASLSPALTETCQRMNIADEKIAVIPVGVDVDLFSPLHDKVAVSHLREKLELPQNAKIVVFVGGIMKRKGVDLLIDAWSLVAAREPDVYLVCIGSIGSSAASRVFYEEQTQKIIDLNLQEKVTLTGRVNNVHEYFQASDIFVLPSTKEGLPNSVLEAMACELPPVMSDIPGISRTVIRSLEEGTVFEERKPEILAKALLELLQDDNRRITVGHNARQRILEAYSINSRTKQYDALYRTLAGELEIV